MSTLSADTPNTGAARELTYAQAANEAIRIAMESDSSVILMGEDVGAYGNVFGVTQGLFKQFGPERVLDTPISENTFIGAAVGAAMCGMRPIVELMFADFLGFAMNPLLNQAAKARYMFGGRASVPLVMRTTIGAGQGAAAQHSQTLYSMFAHIPGLITVAPGTPYALKGLLLASIEDDNPIVVCEHKTLYTHKGPVPEGSYTLALGKGELVREGRDITVVAASYMRHQALEAAAELERDGVSVELIDPLSIYPLDEDLIIGSVEKTSRLVVIDEDTPFCGFGSEVVGLVARKAFDVLDSAPILVTPPHVPVPFSPPLEKAYLPTSKAVESAVRRCLDRVV